ncbi:TRANSLATION INITIATION FACTOR EIF-2B SUBUNIT EPSILON [Salix purpurea]|uniref:Translation initiation factor eIF2B subunit epsilon n=1 Tax=Salix purpurea TaxID=77065 RepID=A0A9Q0P059_SALPP|nr:TRANSLATION INITIATION FACTOR EIF-2B SUBUNIT EPSILON [Salix purpurea]
MIDYTLAWLESAGVEELFVFCCAHSKQVIEYLEKSEWFSQPNFSVVTIESHNSVSAGDALRLIYERNVINGDFVLISGDTVSNMSLTQVIQEHKERRKKDSIAVMTMVIKQSKPSPITHQSRLGTDELFLAIDPQTKQLLFYEEKTDNYRGIIPLDNALLGDNPPICLHNDKQDCYIDICSQEVLSLFTDNFDYQHLRRHFVKGLLEILLLILKEKGCTEHQKLSNHVLHILVLLLLLEKALKLGTTPKFQILSLGKGCSIGSNVSITGSYIWDSITIEDGCDIRHAIICDGVVIKSGATLEPGVVLFFKVVIGQQCIVPSYSKVSLYQQPTVEDSDEELEYADNNSGTVDSSITCTVDTLNREMMSETPASQLGPGCVGHVWSICEGAREEEWRHSVAPIPADKLTEAIQSLEDDLELLNLDGNALSVSGELKSGRNEVEATFLRAVNENIKVPDVILEMNSLRLSYNMTSADCAGAIFYAMMKQALEIPHAAAGELRKSVASIIDAWNKLLKLYSKEIDHQIEMIMKFEEMCLESVKEFSPHFSQILHLLYDKDILEEDAILRWADEKKDAEESDKVFVKQSEKLIQWLREASEEED